jgi:hypothetical protein
LDLKIFQDYIIFTNPKLDHGVFVILYAYHSKTSSYFEQGNRKKHHEATTRDVPLVKGKWPNMKRVYLLMRVHCICKGLDRIHKIKETIA